LLCAMSVRVLRHDPLHRRLADRARPPVVESAHELRNLRAVARDEDFLEPGEEVLVADAGDDVAAHVEALTAERARQIGARARERVLAEHTYERRAAQVEELLGVRV